MTSSPDDETGSERNRHRSGEHRISRWRRRHEDEVVAELDPAEAALLTQRAADADREPGSAAREALQRADADDPAIRRVISDALEGGLADPIPADDRWHLLPRRRSEGDRPAAPPSEPESPASPDLEARVVAAEERAEEYAEQLRQLQAELEEAEQRSRTLATESAARATEHSERVRALVAEREAAEERARSLADHAPEQAGAEVTDPDDATAAMAASQAAAEERIRTLTERNALYSERIDALLADAEAHQALAEAEARIAALERQLDEAHVLPVFAPVAELVEPDVEPLPEPGPEIEEPEDEVDEIEVEPDPVLTSTVATRTAPPSYHAKRGAGLFGPSAGVVALGCAAAVGWMAYQATVLDHLGLSLVLTPVALLGLAIALRQRSKSSEVHLEKGTLRLRHGDQHHTFYLTSTSTRLEMSGNPGDKDWKVQVLRRGLAPVTIDRKDVDPVAFTGTLRHWRPDV